MCQTRAIFIILAKVSSWNLKQSQNYQGKQESGRRILAPNAMKHGSLPPREQRSFIYNSSKVLAPISGKVYNILLKPWFPRTVEGLLVTQGLKEPLVSQSSIYQIGGQPKHRAEELVFSLKSIVIKYRKQGKPVIIQSSDIF